MFYSKLQSTLLGRIKINRYGCIVGLNYRKALLYVEKNTETE